MKACMGLQLHKEHSVNNQRLIESKDVSAIIKIWKKDVICALIFITHSDASSSKGFY